MQLADFVDLANRVGPILVFLVAITVVAELADGIGLFAIIARWAAVLGRGSVLGLWLLVVIVATVATAVLSLDTTAVLLTPVVLVLARPARARSGAVRLHCRLAGQHGIAGPAGVEPDQPARVRAVASRRGGVHAPDVGPGPGGLGGDGCAAGGGLPATTPRKL